VTRPVPDPVLGNPMFVVWLLVFGLGIPAIMFTIFRWTAANDKRPGRIGDEEKRDLWRVGLLPLDAGDPDGETSRRLLLALGSKWRVIHVSADETRVLHRMVLARKAKVLAWLTDRTGHADLTAIASHRTILPAIRRFELKYRRGDYLRPARPS
jgi:hypothetical protein